MALSLTKLPSGDRFAVKGDVAERSDTNFGQGLSSSSLELALSDAGGFGKSRAPALRFFKALLALTIFGTGGKLSSEDSSLVDLVI